MSESKGKKTVAVFYKAEGPSPIEAGNIHHKEGMPEICGACANRCSGLVFGYYAEVAVDVKALPGSKENGCKTIDPRLVEATTLEPLPVCFHPGRWIET